MKRELISRACRYAVLAAMALTPATALGARDEQERDPVDARLEGYAGNVSLPESSTGFTWIVAILLGVVCCGGLFKDAKRTHLD